MSTDLWSFALALYARPGVEKACLSAQDRGANVCLLLCAAWLDAAGVVLSPAREQALRQLAGAHEAHITAPLRELRQAWREAAASDTALARLREEIKRLELQSERMLCERLQALCEKWERQTERTGADAWLTALTDSHELRRLLHEQRRALAAQ